MNILLLGNGFDLHYKLPTSYRNFLLTLDFLIHNDIKNINNVGDVFGNSKLNEQDYFIKESYDKYKKVYDKIKLEQEKLQNMIEKIKNNVWFTYLIESFNKDVGWIDFEKEIAYVIECFKSFFEKIDVSYTKKCIRFATNDNIFKDNGVRYVITEKFNFFLDQYSDTEITINSEYTYEYPLLSRNYRIDKKKIIDYLYNHFQDLAEALKTYLYLFIDKTTELLCATSSEESSVQPEIPQMKLMEYSSVVISFNYTHTYKLLFQSSQIFFTPEIVHIHGETDEEIVLGVNSDKNDRKENVDTSFLRFKKYYQRTYYQADYSYLRGIRAFRENLKKEDNNCTKSQSINLLVFGHSLDVADEKYIRELFGLATKIRVFYHKDTAKKQYIENLVNIFGGYEFEKIRDEKHLEFLNLKSDLLEYLMRCDMSLE